MAHSPLGRLAGWLASFFGAFLLLALWLIPLTAIDDTPAGNDPDPATILRVYYESPDDIERLQAYDLLEFNNQDEGYVLVAANAGILGSLRREGWRVIIDFEGTEQLRQLRDRRLFAEGYRSVKDLHSDLKQLNLQYQELSELVTYGSSSCLTQGGCTTPGGDTLAGYPLVAIRITNEYVSGSSTILPTGTVNPGTKPVFFLVANIHAREITTPEIAMRLAGWLLDQYGKDADLTWLVDYHEIWIVPTANPDGHHLVELGDTPGGENTSYFQRKNANNDADGDGIADCLDWPPTTFRQYGVDLNRNHSFAWGPPGSSDKPCEQTYRGPHVGSEVETTHLENLVRSLIPDQRGPEDDNSAPDDTNGLLITMHSYGELVLWPWGHVQSAAPNASGLKALGDRMADFNGYKSCQPSLCLYGTNGTTDDWAYGELGIPAFTFEVGSTFMPPFSEIEDTQWPGNREALLYAARVARVPYETVRGPETQAVTTTLVSPRQIVITAEISNLLGSGTPVSEAVVAIDTPFWISGTHPVDMSAVDGAFDGPVEKVTATLDAGNLSLGRHTAFVRGRSTNGDWGLVGATFFSITGPGQSIAKEATLTTQDGQQAISYTINYQLENDPIATPFILSITDTIPTELMLITDTISVTGLPAQVVYDEDSRTLQVEAQGTMTESLLMELEFTVLVAPAPVVPITITNVARVRVALDGVKLPLQNASVTTYIRPFPPVDLSYLPVVIWP